MQRWWQCYTCVRRVEKRTEWLVDVAKPRVGIPVRESWRIETSEYLEVGAMDHREVSMCSVACLFAFIPNSRGNAKVW
jgi:hypothetical protein